MRTQNAITLLLSFWSISQAQIGINLSLAERGGTFADLVRENYRWNVNGQGITSGQVDAHGWPTVDADFIYDGRPVAEWAEGIDDPEAYRIDMSGTYHARFSGKATVTATGAQIAQLQYDSTLNRTTFDMILSGPPGANHGFFVLQFRKTQATPSSAQGTGIQDFRLMRPGYALDRADPFTTGFISALSGIPFSCIRFMGFSATNDVDPVYPATTKWSQAKSWNDASQDRIPTLKKNGGAAWELAIALGNRLNTDIWINVPVSADSDYVRQLATMVRDSLKPELHVYVESSNEVWNSIFPQQPYNVAQSKALGIGEHENHARRTVELARIFASVFGTGSLNNRVRVVLCSHEPMLKWWVEPMLAYVKKTFGEPSQYLWAISRQGYFSIPTVKGQTVASILDTGRAHIQAQIDETGGVNESGRKQWVAKAAAWKLPGGLVIYEGGAHPELGNLGNLANTIAAERSPGMGDLIQLNYRQAFLDVGGTLAMHFTLSSAYTRYGCFGLTDDINKPERNFKYAALREVANGATGNPIRSKHRLHSVRQGRDQSQSPRIHVRPRSSSGTKTVYGLNGQTVHPPEGKASADFNAK